jgi:rod shape-determining protein MreD
MTDASSRAPGRRTLRLVIALLLAFSLHAAYDSRLMVAGAQPNLSLTALLTACLFTDCETAAWLGFLVGLLEASYTARYIGSFIVTRTLAGFLVGLLEERIFRDNVFVAIAAVFLGTLFTNTCFFLFAPQPHAARWFLHALTQAAYNAVLAIPVYAIFKRLIPRVGQ